MDLTLFLKCSSEVESFPGAFLPPSTVASPDEPQDGIVMNVSRVALVLISSFFRNWIALINFDFSLTCSGVSSIAFCCVAYSIKTTSLMERWSPSFVSDFERVEKGFVLSIVLGFL